jgi:hypothetical protein
MSNVKYDVVDLYLKLENEFPHIEFITEDEIIKGKTLHKFKIRTLNKTAFKPPVKTTIFIEKNGEIEEKEYQKISDNVRKSFGTTLQAI